MARPDTKTTSLADDFKAKTEASVVAMAGDPRVSLPEYVAAIGVLRALKNFVLKNQNGNSQNQVANK